MHNINEQIIRDLLSKCEDKRAIPVSTALNFGKATTSLGDTDSRETSLMIARLTDLAVAGIEFLATEYYRYDQDPLFEVRIRLLSATDLKKNQIQAGGYSSPGDEFYKITRPIIDRVRQAQVGIGNPDPYLSMDAIAMAVCVLARCKSFFGRSHTVSGSSSVPHVSRPKEPELVLWYEANPRGRRDDPRVFLGL